MEVPGHTQHIDQRSGDAERIMKFKVLAVPYKNII